MKTGLPSAFTLISSDEKNEALFRFTYKNKQTALRVKAKRSGSRYWSLSSAILRPSLKMKKKTSPFGPHQASLALVLERNQKWITGVGFIVVSESNRGQFLRACIHGSIQKTGRSHHGIIYGFFPLFSLVRALMRVGMQGQKREFQYTQSFTLAPPLSTTTPPITWLITALTRKRGGLVSKGAEYHLKGLLHLGNNTKIMGILNHWSGLNLLTPFTCLVIRIFKK